MTTVGSSCEIHMQLKGLVDVPKEISRLEETIDKKESQRAKLMKDVTMEDYEKKVCEELECVSS